MGTPVLGDVLCINRTENQRRLNYGERVDGPWVFGMIQMGTSKVKMFYVPDRKASTLIPILIKHVPPETTIWSDEWRAYVIWSDEWRAYF